MPAKAQIVADEVDESVQEPTLRETIEAARDEVVSRQENDNVVDRNRAVTTDSGTDAPRSGESDRTADGRFARKQQDGSGKSDKADGTGNGSSSAGNVRPNDSDGNAKGGQANPSDLSGAIATAQVAPRSWKAEEKALWSQVPPAVQAIINRRESDVQKQIAQQGQIASIGNEFMQVANEFAPIVQARGGNPVAMFKDFMRIMGALHNAPDPQSRAAVFQQVAAQQGVDLRALGIQAQPSQQQGQPFPPQQIHSLVQQEVNNRLTAWQQQMARQQEEQAMQQTSNEIEAFRTKVDAQGKPLYPHFDAVTSLMTSLINSGAASSLEDAYPLAVRAHPETSKLIEAEQKAAVEAAQAAQKAKEEQQRKAHKAQRAAGSIRGSPGSAAPNGKADRSVREELQAAFAEARGRV